VGFVDRPVDEGKKSGVVPPWLTIHFDRPSDSQDVKQGTLQQYTLQPGDAATVELALNVSDISRVQDLNEGPEKVEDVLVLRIHNGRDYFLPIRGTWLQSSLGRSIDKLRRIPEGGIRKLQHQRPDRSSHNHGDEGVKWSAPREIFRLTEAIEELMERTVAEWGMRAENVKPPWEGTAWPFAGWITPEKQRETLKYYVREALDTDTSFNELVPAETSSLQRLEAVAETLLAFLGSLEDGIVTEAQWTELEKGIVERGKSKPVPTEDERMQILELLSQSPPHSTLFSSIVFTLSRVADQIAPFDIGHALPIGDGPSRSSKEEVRTQQRVHEAAKNRRRELDAAYAAVFALIMIRVPETSKEKERKATELRKKYVVETFLNSRWAEEES
jgi:phosphatidylinositol-bisphosphatase